MATNAQIVLARATQTQGVWNLQGGFTFSGISKDDHREEIGEVQLALAALNTAEGTSASAVAALAVEHAFFKTMNVALGQRLDSEVPNDAPLQKRVDEADDIDQESVAKIAERTVRTIAIWKEVNAANAAMVPVQPAVTVRGVAAAAYETRWNAVQAKKATAEEKRGALSAKRTDLKTRTRKLDRWNKDWYQGWASEYPPGTPEGDALGGVDTEQGTLPPQILEITAVTQEGLSLKVDYDADSGLHATVLELLYKVAGVNPDSVRVPADKAAGNVIGPFVAGQTVTLRTDVGNSRDSSELGAEQTKTIA